MGADKHWHRSCSEHIPVELWSRGSSRWKTLSDCQWWMDSWWWSLAISRIRWKLIAQRSEWKAHWCTQSFVPCCRDRVQRTTRFLPRTWRWTHDSYSQQHWSGNGTSFWETGELVRERTNSFRSISKTFSISTWTEKWSLKKSTAWTAQSSVLRRWINSRETSTAQRTARKSNANSESRSSTNWWWHRTTLGISWRCRNGKRRRWGTLGSRNSQSQNESEESNEQRETRTWRFRTCCPQELVCCLCWRSRCWWTTSDWTVGRRGERKNDSDFDYVFLTQENADTFSNSDLLRHQVWSNGIDMLWTERSQSILHFMSCGFHQRSWFSQNHFEMR